MKVATYLLVGVALGLTACKPVEDKAAAPKVDKATVEQSIRDKETGWMAAYNKHDATQLTAQYEEDAGLATNGVAVMTDAAGRQKFLEGFAALPDLQVEFGSDRIIVADSGELASSRGHYTVSYTDAATKKPVTESGTYLTVYRKGADGSWKAVEDMTVPGAPVTAPAG